MEPVATNEPVTLDSMIVDPAKVSADTGTGYPTPYRHVVAGRERRALGDAVDLTIFGVNLTRLAPGAASALRHWHDRQDEFVYVLEGELTLVTDVGEQVLRPGMGVGFPAGRPIGHHLVNRSSAPAVYLEIGDRTRGDQTHYSEADLVARMNDDGTDTFTHKDGAPW